MKVVVITGSTRGIGLGLAQAFLQMGCAVSISGRTEKFVRSATETLVRQYGRDRILGSICDVRDDRQVQNLWNMSRQVFSKVDIWINNAGIANSPGKFWDQTEGSMSDLVDTNLLGTMYGAKTALRGMLAQGHGALYTMLGFGSNGRVQDGLLLYGTSKSALQYFTKALAMEARGLPVLIGSISPGMVLTELYTNHRRASPEASREVKNVLNLLGERVETIAPWLAKRIFQNKKNGAEIRWLTFPRLMIRLMTYPFNPRRLVK